MDVDALALRALVALEAGAPLPPDVASWLAGGLRAVSIGKGNTLDAVLGFKRAGRRTVETRRALETRNYWLRQAAGHLEGSTTARAEELAALVSYYQSRIPPHRRRPECLSGPLQAIALADAAGVGLPTSARRLRSILGNEPPAF